MCGDACVCWFSRTQKCGTLSTSEADCSWRRSERVVVLKASLAFHDTREGNAVFSGF